MAWAMPSGIILTKRIKRTHIHLHPRSPMTQQRKGASTFYGVSVMVRKQTLGSEGLREEPNKLEHIR